MSGIYFPNKREMEAKYDEIVTLNIHQRIPRLKQQKTTKNAKNAKHTNGFTVTGTTFMFFIFNMKTIVDKSHLISFLKRMKVSTRDPQPRHLGMQYGYDFLVAGCIHPSSMRKLKPGEYCLLSLKKHSTFSASHRFSTVTDLQFIRLKSRFDYHCACCGSVEGEPHLKNKRLQTRLERGHMNPLKPLILRNCLPICSMCNGVYKNIAVFNRNGFITNWKFSKK